MLKLYPHFIDGVVFADMGSAVDKILKDYGIFGLIALGVVIWLAYTVINQTTEKTGINKLADTEISKGCVIKAVVIGFVLFVLFMVARIMFNF